MLRAHTGPQLPNQPGSAPEHPSTLHFLRPSGRILPTTALSRYSLSRDEGRCAVLCRVQAVLCGVQGGGTVAQLTPELFRFFEDLEANNDRTWFKTNQARFETSVREPLLAFVAEFEEPLAAISPSMLAVAKRSGGSLFRIHRDTRFAKDKSPYKTWAAVQFRHEAGRDAHAPCYYLHLAPGDVFVGAGIWHPDRTALDAIRARIDEHRTDWEQARDALLRAGWILEGEALKRIPRGYDSEHPLADDLRRKDFIAVRRLTEKDAIQAGFLERYTNLCREPVELMKFLTAALGLLF